MKMKEFLGPVLATFVLILLGDGVVANCVLAPRGALTWYSWPMIAFGWSFAVIVAGLIVPADNNPAITLAMAIRGTTPWKKVLPTWIGTFIGGFLGAFAVFLVYHEGLVSAGLPNVWTSGSGALYDSAHNAAGSYSILNASVAEFFGTLILMWTVLAVGDKRNTILSKAGPFPVGGAILVIGLCLGGPSGYSLNPARDLAPRIFGAISGTQGLFNDLYWLIPPVLVPCLACIVASFLYDLTLAEKAS